MDNYESRTQAPIRGARRFHTELLDIPVLFLRFGSARAPESYCFRRWSVNPPVGGPSEQWISRVLQGAAHRPSPSALTRSASSATAPSICRSSERPAGKTLIGLVDHIRDGVGIGPERFVAQARAPGLVAAARRKRRRRDGQRPEQRGLQDEGSVRGVDGGSSGGGQGA